MTHNTEVGRNSRSSLTFFTFHRISSATPTMMIDDTLPKPCNEVAPLISGSGHHDPVPLANNDGTRHEFRSSLSASSQDFHDIASTITKIECTGLSSFPFRLHQMLNDSTKKGFEDVVCWRDDGRSFLIRDKNRFATNILPEYFQGQTHYKSFQRQRKFFSSFSSQVHIGHFKRLTNIFLLLLSWCSVI